MIAFEPMHYLTDSELDELFRRALGDMRSCPLVLREVLARRLAAVEKELAKRKEEDARKP